jgi:hypothetical protein
MTDLEPLMTCADLGTLLHRSGRWVQARATEGVIGGTLVGRSYQFTREQAEAAIQALAKPARITPITARTGMSPRARRAS